MKKPNDHPPTSGSTLDADEGGIGGIDTHPDIQREESAWASYAPIGSDTYVVANQKRVKDAQIKVEKLGDPKHSITLVASVKVDPETGRAVSGHETRPDAESMQATEQAFRDYLANTPAEKRVVIFEGDERIFGDRNEAVARASDSGLVQHLAAREQVPATSGEPTEIEAVDAMEQLGVSREELLALYVARGLESHVTGSEASFIAGYINHHAASLGLEGFREFSETEKQEIAANGKLEEVKAELNKKASELLPALNALYRPVLDNKDLLITSEDGDISINPEFAGNISVVTMDKLGWNGPSRINEIARLSMEMRDRVILHRIIEAYKEGKSPFVVYGGSHIVTLKPALEAYLSD